MRNTFLVLLLYLSLSVSGATYYIDPSGQDATTNNGSKSYPWKTLAYACSKVKTAGDIIHVNSGTYLETVQSTLAAGVSIEGEGVGSSITSNISKLYTFTILLSSSSSATDGEQHISNIKMDGNALTAYGAIRVAYRKNVEIYNCTFIDFNYYGVSFINGEPPQIYATGNKFHDNIVTNCSGYFSGNRGSLEIQGQDGMLIYNNTMTQNRSNGLNGDIIYGVEGYLKNVKIYNNILSKTYVPGTTPWDFAIEFWNCLGGVEIYNNTITGSIDLANCINNSSAYSVWIHNNIIGQSALTLSESTRGVLLEATVEDIIIEANDIRNVTAGVFFSQVQSARSVKNIYIKCNIISNIGVSDLGPNSKGWGIYWTAETYKNHTVNNLNICNNVLIGNSGARSNMWGINLPNIGTSKNITIRNNIIKDFDYAPIYAYTQTGAQTIDMLSIENNIFYQNGNSNLPRYSGIIPTNNTTRNNIINSPLFISTSDFHLQSGSPAIGKGLKITSITNDFDGNAFSDPPTIGAYEYFVSAIPVYKSSVIANATPSILEMNYNFSLASINPATSAFSVLVNSVAKSVNSVAISGTKVRLTLSTPVVYGDIITVSYSKPIVNPLQALSGGEADNITSQTVTNNVASNVPVCSGSAIENATPALLGMTYNLTLANVVPAASAFSVLVNSQARTVNTVAISGTKVQLTLASPVIYGDVVTVSYTKPSGNPLQTITGGQAEDIAGRQVTNNIVSAAPVCLSSAIENATPSLLEMTYSLTLANVVPSSSAFSVRVNSKARTVNKVAISGTKVQLTLASPVVYGDVVTVSYTKPSGNPLQTVSGGQASTISVQAVVNKVSSVSPVYVSSSIENATPSLLEITYNLTLANVVPSVSAFTVLVNTKAKTVSKVAVSGTRVQLTLANPVVFGDIVTVSYTKPSKNALKTASGGKAVSISNQPVINNCINIAPVALITYPINNGSFTAPANITITANVSDADGSVALVEFYNGNTKLGSVSATPYSFAWNNIGAGIYSLTVVATDNNNAKTTSSPISISVTNETDTINVPPVVEISNPQKGNKYENSATIDIEAMAYDPDGTIRKVEFYNGSTKLVELTSSPYLFSWKDVNAGTYTITAVATDNSNVSSVSSPVDFIVNADFKYDANSEIINLYPNPNDGHFSIELLKPLEDEKCEIVIADLGGKKVSSVSLTSEETVKQFDLPFIKSGIYIMMIIGQGILVTKKFIKK